MNNHDTLCSYRFLFFVFEKKNRKEMYLIKLIISFEPKIKSKIMIINKRIIFKYTGKYNLNSGGNSSSE